MWQKSNWCAVTNVQKCHTAKIERRSFDIKIYWKIFCCVVQIDRNLSCCTDECNLQRIIAHVLQSTKGSQSTDREGITVCDRSAACARRPWTWTTSCCSRTESRGKGSTPLEVRLSCDQIEVGLPLMTPENFLPAARWELSWEPRWEETEGEEAVKQLNVNLQPALLWGHHQGGGGSVDYNCLLVVFEVSVKMRKRQEEL